MELLARFDAFPKFNKDFVRRTHTGACVSIFTICLITSLFVSEVSTFLTPERVHRLEVDSSLGEQMRINFDITFPRLPCAFVSLDVMDESGEHQVAVSQEHVVKKRLSKDGRQLGTSVRHTPGETIKSSGELLDAEDAEDAVQGAAGEEGGEAKAEAECLSCYGAGEEGDCCNTCNAVRRAYKVKGWAFTLDHSIPVCVKEHTMQMGSDQSQGCNLAGYVEVDKVAGNIHFAPSRGIGDARMHVGDLLAFTMENYNLTHVINWLAFGEQLEQLVGLKQPLVDRERIHEGPDSGMYQYYLKVVPMVFEDVDGQTVTTKQYAVTEHFRSIDVRAATAGGGKPGRIGGGAVPGVFFFYDTSSVRVHVEEKRRSFFHFLTMVSAIVGGVFTVMGVVDGAIEKLVSWYARGGGVLSI